MKVTERKKEKKASKKIFSALCTAFMNEDRYMNLLHELTYRKEKKNSL
jgi:hypothetical protein